LAREKNACREVVDLTSDIESVSGESDEVVEIVRPTSVKSILHDAASEVEKETKEEMRNQLNCLARRYLAIRDINQGVSSRL